MVSASQRNVPYAREKVRLQASHFALVYPSPRNSGVEIFTPFFRHPPLVVVRSPIWFFQYSSGGVAILPLHLFSIFERQKKRTCFHLLRLNKETHLLSQGIHSKAPSSLLTLLLGRFRVGLRLLFSEGGLDQDRDGMLVPGKYPRCWEQTISSSIDCCHITHRIISNPNL